MSLCPEAKKRAAMTDAEFWDDVARNLLGDSPMSGEEPEAPSEVEMAELHLIDPCPECGATGACGYDEMGRPMIHAVEVSDG